MRFLETSYGFAEYIAPLYEWTKAVSQTASSADNVLERM